jgi:hypothetical protein
VVAAYTGMPFFAETPSIKGFENSEESIIRSEPSERKIIGYKWKICILSTS